MAKKRNRFGTPDNSLPVSQPLHPHIDSEQYAALNKIDTTAIDAALAEQPVESNLAEDNGPSDTNRALTHYMNGDWELVHRWFIALNEEPDSFVYDIFSRAELAFVTEDLSGDVEDVVNKLTTKYLELEATMSNEEQIEKGSDDTLALEQATDTGDTATPEPFNYEGFRGTYTIPDGWTNEDIDQWALVEGYNLGERGLTERYHFVIDPTRSRRDIASWSVDEILDGFEGKLDQIGEDQYGALAKAFKQKTVVDPAWTVRELIDFLTQGLEPTKTSNGAWRNDVTRARRPAFDWTTQELVAWALGEIKAVGEATDQKIAIELNKRLDLASQTNAPEDVKRAYIRTQNKTVVVGEQPTATTPEPTLTPVEQKETPIPQGLNAMNAAYLKTQTERYLAACKPGTPITLEQGAKEQRELDNLFRYILKIEDPVGFGSALIYFRDFYKANRSGLFDPTYATRFTGSLRTDGNIQETHINLLAIFHVYTDDDKAARKQIDLPYLLSKFPSARQAWLLEFFQRYC